MSDLATVLGGSAAIRIVVQDLYLRACADPALREYALDVDRRRVRTHMIELLEQGADTEQMRSTLAGLGVAPALVDALVSGLVPLRAEIAARLAAA